MLELNNVSVAYDKQLVVNKLSCSFHRYKITTIIGPNGCGKSTLLKALTKTKSLEQGTLKLMGKCMKTYKTKELAKLIALLPQNPHTPYSLTAKQLISLGRYPFQKWGRGLTKVDMNIIKRVIQQTNLTELQHKYLHQMSGGEKQRAWIAMTLAQEPKLLILDEPTTFLDINHQYEILELVKSLNQELRITVIMVLHDINQAARYSDNIMVMKQGELIAHGEPKAIITKQLLKDVFEINANVINDEYHNKPLVIPI